MKEGWEYKKLGEVCEILDSQRKPITKGKRESGSIPYYGATGCLDYVKDYIFDEKLVLLGEDGAKWGAGENSAYIINGKSWVNNHAHALRPKRDILVDELLVYYLNYSNLLTYITGVTVPKLNQEKMRSIEIPIGPVEEQHSIVSRLDAAFTHIDELKANAEKALNEAKALFQASLKEMLEPKEGWEEKKLSDITEVKDGTHDSPRYVPVGIPFVTQKNITNNGFELLNTKKITIEDHNKFYTRSNVEYGDIIISMIGANRGMSCIVDTREIFSIKNVGLIKKSDNINTMYLLFYLHSPAAYAYVLDNSNGGAQEFIGLKGLRNFPIPYPPLSEQQSIVATLDSLKSKVDRLQENFDKISQECDALKQAILRQVFV